MPEQARVGQLASGEIQRQLVLGDLEVAAEVGEVLRQDRRVTVGHDGDADIPAADDLGGEATDDVAELRGEERAADRAHQASGARDHLLHVVRGLLTESVGERVRDAGGDGFGQLLPDRERGGHPRAARHDLGGMGEVGDRRRLAQPQGGERERLIQVGALTRRDAEAVLVGDVEGLPLGEAPVDAVLRPREGALQLIHDRLHHRRVDLHPGQARELFGIQARGVAGHQAPHELLELLLGAPVVVCHFSRLSAGSGGTRSTLVARFLASLGSAPRRLRRARTTRQR
ncbi:hypothetical protein SRABI128_03447 [Microbacterium sp. Bi128]|nr:hypothetical protein SRABI128_03447 [Microbacterium sp. Bi128]